MRTEQVGKTSTNDGDDGNGNGSERSECGDQQNESGGDDRRKYRALGE